MSTWQISPGKNAVTARQGKAGQGRAIQGKAERLAGYLKEAMFKSLV